MKVLDLACAHEHSFEGWFASEEDFQGQLGRGLVQCPLCGDTGIRKLPSAPRLNLHGAGACPAAAEEAGAAPAPGPQQPGPPAQAREWQAALLQLARQVALRTEDVGDRFAEQARRMHYGEIEERGIRGRATAQQAAQLLDEGIPVLPLLLPEAAKEPLQ